MATINEKFLNEISKRSTTWTTREQLEDKIRLLERKNDILQAENQNLYDEKTKWKENFQILLTSVIFTILLLLTFYFKF